MNFIFKRRASTYDISEGCNHHQAQYFLLKVTLLWSLLEKALSEYSDW